jgi:hypothetical protein
MDGTEFFQQIDWAALAAQKRALEDAIEHATAEDKHHDDTVMSDGLIGLLYLIDSIQNFAVNDLGMGQDTIYPDEKDENDNETN